jgi:hypothetical protein
MNGMTLIDKNGQRPVCVQCHKVNVKIGKRAKYCENCNRKSEARRAGELMDFIQALQDRRKACS